MSGGPAPTDVFEIRRSIVRVSTFRGYRPAPVAFSGFVGIAAAGLQTWVQPSPAGFVALWITAAFVGFGYNFWCIARSYGASPRRWERSLAFAALNDLSPSLFASALLTIVFSATGRYELLPGLWMVLFGTGILSSRRHLPLPGTLVGGVYVALGTLVLYALPGDAPLRAEVMGGVFGGGQLLLAAVLSRWAP